MPLIATPISHLFENPQYGNEIAEVSDCLEVRQRSLGSVLPKQWLFHIDIDISLEWNDEIRDYLKNAFKIKSELKLVTFQATRCCQGERIVDGKFQLSGTVYTEQEMLNHASENVTWLRAVLKKEIKIGLENNNYYPTPAYDLVTDGSFVTKLVEQNNIYLLLDIAHAMVTAHNKKIEYLDYIDTLPLEKLIQLHICQPVLPVGEIAQDTHDDPTPEMLDEIIRLIKLFPQVEYLTVEYYKDKYILTEAINELLLRLK